MKKVSWFLVLFLLLLTMSPLQASTKSDDNEFFADLNVIAYPAGGWSVPIGLLSGIAIEMYNSNTSHYTVKHYNKWNKFCGILGINKYNYHAGSKKLGEVVQNPTWLSTPYDYTQPAACRILEDKY